MEIALEILDEDTLTVAEVATAADVTSRYVNQVIEEHVMPEELYVTGGKRRFLPSAAAFVALNCKASSILTREARHTAYESLLLRFHDELVSSEWKKWNILLARETVDLDMVTIRVVTIFDEVAKRLDEMQEAKKAVVRDPEILSGIPVIAGTRVPVYDIAASVDKGVSHARLAKGFGIDSEQIRLACLWAKANPPMGRPKRALAPVPINAAVKRISRKRRAD